MTLLFKLVPVGESNYPAIQVNAMEEGRYAVSLWFDDQCAACDRFDTLEYALLRVAGTVREGVQYYGAYRDPRPLNGIGSGGTGSRRQDALSGADADEWRARGI